MLSDGKTMNCEANQVTMWGGEQGGFPILYIGV